MVLFGWGVLVMLGFVVFFVVGSYLVVCNFFEVMLFGYIVLFFVGGLIVMVMIYIGMIVYGFDVIL